VLDSAAYPVSGGRWQAREEARERGAGDQCPDQLGVQADGQRCAGNLDVAERINSLESARAFG
jgi:hypothetical protein